VKKFLAVFLVVGMLATVLTGCSFLQKAKDISDNLDDIVNDLPGNNDDDDDDDDPGNNEDESIFSGTVYYPEGWGDPLKLFSEFGYEWTDKTENGSQLWSIHFVYQDSEEVDGVPTDIMQVTKVENGETVVETHWYNDEGNLVKAMAGEEEIDTWYAIPLTMLLSIYTNKVLLTSTVVAEDGILDAFGYTLEEKRTESSDVGQMSVYQIRSKLLPAIYIYGLVEKGGVQHFAKIRLEAPDSDIFEQVLVTAMETR